MRFFRDPEAYATQLTAGEPFTRLYGVRARFVLVRDPEAIWKVLVSDAADFRVGRWKLRARRIEADALNTLDGEIHRERRRAIAPALIQARVAERSSLIVEGAERMAAGWADGATIVARDHLQRLALCTAGELLFSTDLGDAAEDLIPALVRIEAALPHRIPPRLVPGPRRALRQARDVVDQIVRQRVSDPAASDDALSGLLDAGVPLPAIHSDVLALLIAAVSEPPRALEAAWYLLAQAPEAEHRLHDEVAHASADADLPYLGGVVKETLRLHPPVRHVDRLPMRGAVIAGRRLGRSENVIVSPVVTHRDPALYVSPDEFRPERWLADDGDLPRRRGAYLPFGAGRHACVGAALARSIMSLTLATVARNWRLRLAPEATDPRRAPTRFTLERW